MKKKNQNTFCLDVFLTEKKNHAKKQTLHFTSFFVLFLYRDLFYKIIQISEDEDSLKKRNCSLFSKLICLQEKCFLQMNKYFKKNFKIKTCKSDQSLQTEFFS